MDSDSDSDSDSATACLRTQCDELVEAHRTAVIRVHFCEDGIDLCIVRFLSDLPHCRFELFLVHLRVPLVWHGTAVAIVRGYASTCTCMHVRDMR